MLINRVIERDPEKAPPQACGWVETLACERTHPLPI
jgi:hypothetical protein